MSCSNIQFQCDSSPNFKLLRKNLYTLMLHTKVLYFSSYCKNNNVNFPICIKMLLSDVLFYGYMHKCFYLLCSSLYVLFTGRERGRRFPHLGTLTLYHNRKQHNVLTILPLVLLYKHIQPEVCQAKFNGKAFSFQLRVFLFKYYPA